MHLPLRPTPVALAAAFFATFSAMTAQAQTQPQPQPQPQPQTPATPPAQAEAPGDRQTIMITATKREAPAHRVPINVTAIGEAQLREENITDLK